MTRRQLAVAVCALVAAASWAETAQACHKCGRGHRGRTYYYSGAGGHYAGAANYAGSPGCGCQGSYAGGSVYGGSYAAQPAMYAGQPAMYAGQPTYAALQAAGMPQPAPQSPQWGTPAPAKTMPGAGSAVPPAPPAPVMSAPRAS